MPMFQADALWLRFESATDFEADEYPVAVKIGVSKICAVSGDRGPAA